ncbi:phage portal protein [Actinophytocola sediminis]
MLINAQTHWPPPGHWRMRERWLSWAAWWSGDLHRLMVDSPYTAPGGYWARRNKIGSTKIHLPLAGDLARTAAELMYGDTPAIQWENDQPAQEVWDDLAQQIGWSNTMLESGEVGAALGGSYLKPGWDRSVADHPLPMVVRADHALPTFKFGRLSSVTFVTELEEPTGWTTRSSGEVWRWLEHHEPGQIRHELWLGSASGTGTPLPLTEHEYTRDLEPVIDTRPYRAEGILVEFIPNDLPQPLDVLPLGRSVLQGVETLLDQLDEVWDSWMRDIRLGKGRILLAREMLDPVVGAQKRSALGGMFGRRHTTPGAAFDVDAEAYTGFDAWPDSKEGQPMPIEHVQFGIRMAEHRDTAMALVEQIVSRAGYAPQTMGMHVEGQLSGTAMRRREQRSYRTRDRQRRYARPALERFAETLMMINAEVFGGPRPTGRPTLQWRETDQADPQETATTIELLRRAQALSTETAVAMAHPEWDGDQVDEEVARLLVEQAALMAPAIDEEDPLDPETEDPTGTGVTKAQVDMFRAMWLSGVDPAEAATKAGLGSLTMVENPRPVTVAPAEGEDPPAPAGPPAPGSPPKPGPPAPFPPGR